MGTSTIPMVIFNSYVSRYQRVPLASQSLTDLVRTMNCCCTIVNASCAVLCRSLHACDLCLYVWSSARVPNRFFIACVGNGMGMMQSGHEPRMKYVFWLILEVLRIFSTHCPRDLMERFGWDLGVQDTVGLPSRSRDATGFRHGWFQGFQRCALYSEWTQSQRFRMLVSVRSNA